MFVNHSHQMLKSQSDSQHCPYQPFTQLLHNRGGSGSQDTLPQSLVKKYSLLSPLISSLPASKAACDGPWWLGQPSTNTAACLSLCTQSFQMHVAKTNPVLSPLRDTLFMEPPASSSLAQSSGTSQAGACSEMSSARAESVRAIERKMWILRVDRGRLSRGWPRHLGHLKHRVLSGCSHSSERAHPGVSSSSSTAVPEGMWPLGMALSGAFPGLCHSRTRGRGQGMGRSWEHRPCTDRVSVSGAGLPRRGDILIEFGQQ